MKCGTSKHLLTNNSLLGKIFPEFHSGTLTLGRLTVNCVLLKYITFKKTYYKRLPLGIKSVILFWEKWVKRSKCVFSLYTWFWCSLLNNCVYQLQKKTSSYKCNEVFYDYYMKQLYYGNIIIYGINSLHKWIRSPLR